MYGFGDDPEVGFLLIPPSALCLETRPCEVHLKARLGDYEIRAFRSFGLMLRCSRGLQEPASS